MASPIELLPREFRDLAIKQKQPPWVEPMLATLTEDHFSDPAWLFERKLDGERCLVFRSRRGVELMTRNRKPMNDTYPELEAAFLAKPGHEFIADGEVVTFDGRTTSFSKLQGRMQVRDRETSLGLVREIPVYLYLFDLLHLDGYDLSALPLVDRKRLLSELLDFRGPLRYNPHRSTFGERFLKEACGKGWEGLIAKRAGAPYRHGRSTDWLKFKCMARQEFVIGGYTEPRGSRESLGALLLGYHDRGRLRFAGKVGTGFDEAMLRDLGRKLERSEIVRSPFADVVPERGAHWVSPNFVCEIGFTEWTPGGKLRHPRFLGFRRDKAAREVVREGPK